MLTRVTVDCLLSLLAALCARSSICDSGGYEGVGENLSNSISKQGFEPFSGFEPGIPIGFKVSSSP